ncbi:MAG: exodeoxyribonuclease VII small subunit [Candidatus Fischerbacteria bacterium RBG_13_37_8]|uniref:Exodeoxyribonuclease 7 small subunit n=1 Tax=Candidatus Fischerbacteria bacterium RBG_13_37_8 TaxID=1817863 RepID=A0A1F5VKP8_9BACT|nr:MAG: exodeoxyribonuclease VII small subunit [Candidatus Fischerbacteria bacterium RBG_13_37_8]
MGHNGSEPESFESALGELEAIVKKLGSGDLALEDSIKLFERGVELSHYCTKKLEEAENKISMLVKDQKGEIKPQDFQGDSTEEE